MRATIHGRPHPSLSLEEERTGGPSAGTPSPSFPPPVNCNQQRTTIQTVCHYMHEYLFNHLLN